MSDAAGDSPIGSGGLRNQVRPAGSLAIAPTSATINMNSVSANGYECDTELLYC
ncbi:hypothetical protein [Thermosynechococcus sp.]|uniref:hypothetical protein n=1 Tax=Thermosynechococcus sp. TaxID=2814275 RepID=UPI00391D5877